MEVIIKSVAEYYGVTESDVVKGRRGRGEPLLHRWVAMKLCQDLAGVTLREIASRFSVGNYCTVSQTISRLNKLAGENKILVDAINFISKDLAPN
jgi:chromosomal replication initiation ATPase DnaA